jgi:hypothetical protein
VRLFAASGKPNLCIAITAAALLAVVDAIPPFDQIVGGLPIQPGLR